jgi:CIC family chloride channel protein
MTKPSPTILLRGLLATALVGIAAGLAAVVFQKGADWIMHNGLFRASTGSLWAFVVLALVLMTGGALIAGILMARFAPDAPGSGIPQVKAGYRHGNPDFSWNLVWVKLVGGIVSIGTGSSLGREGPTIHIGAALASKISNWFGEKKDARLNAVCAGSAAGLAAAFNSPLAGVTLVLEEIAGGRYEKQFAGRALLAAALAVLMIYLFMGDRAAFPLTEGLPLTTAALALSPAVALFAGLAGILFQWATLAVRSAAKRLRVPLWLRPAVGAAIGGAACVLAFAFTGRLGAFGLGEADLHATLLNQITWSAAAWLLAAKLIATVFCYGSGGCGGIFAPIIFFGGMAGTVLSGVVARWLDLTPADGTMLSLIGMTACLAAVVRAPITSILIVAEMAREVNVLPGLMIAAVIGAFLNRFAFPGNFYDEALRQDGIRIED